MTLLLSKSSSTQMQTLLDGSDSIDPQAQCSSTQIELPSVAPSLFDFFILNPCSVLERLTYTLRAIFPFGMPNLPPTAYQIIVILISKVTLQI